MDKTEREIGEQRLYNQFITNRRDQNHVVQSLCGLQAQHEKEALRSLSLRITETSIQCASLVKCWTLRGRICYLVGNRSPTYVLAPHFTPLGHDAAWEIIVDRYFTTFGPATMRYTWCHSSLCQRKKNPKVGRQNFSLIPQGGMRNFQLNVFNNIRAPVYSG
jgi:hypothetical protein